MDVRALYHQGEDAWYGLLDKVEKAVPVYKVIDPVDKIIPSFAVALGLVLLLLVFGIILPVFSGSGDVVLSFRDEQGSPAAGVGVQISYNGIVVEETTNSVGKILLKGIANGTTLFVSVQDDTYAPLQSEKNVGNEKTLTFILSLQEAPPSELTFNFTDGGGISLNGKT